MCFVYTTPFSFFDNERLHNKWYKILCLVNMAGYCAAPDIGRRSTNWQPGSRSGRQWPWPTGNRPRPNIYTSISIASISLTGQMKFIPRWTPLAFSPREGMENTNDVRNSPLFLECCYFKIASTRCKAILIASPNKFRISQYRLRLLLFTSFYSVYVQFNKKRGTTVAKQTSFSVMCRTVTSFYIYRK